MTRWAMAGGMLLAAAANALAVSYVFEEDFEAADWFASPESPWTLEGRLTCGIDESNVVQFSPDDANLGDNVDNNGTNSGGIFLTSWSCGDHENVWLDYTMDLPPGQYYFEVSADQYVYWDESEHPAWPDGAYQLWGAGQGFFIGDAADMEYGELPPGQVAPEGPWRGVGWGFPTDAGPGQVGTHLAQIWDPCGQLDENYVCGPEWVGWVSNTYAQTVPGNSADENNPDFSGTDVITVTDPDEDGIGQVVFRMSLRNKWDVTALMAYAMDKLQITLTSVCPEPFADSDEDGDVDHDDFGAWQRCYTGSDDTGDVFDPQACGCFDRDFDQDIDQTDLQAFEACASGPGVAVAPDCEIP